MGLSIYQSVLLLASVALSANAVQYGTLCQPCRPTGDPCDPGMFCAKPPVKNQGRRLKATSVTISTSQSGSGSFSISTKSGSTGGNSRAAVTIVQNGQKVVDKTITGKNPQLDIRVNDNKATVNVSKGKSKPPTKPIQQKAPAPPASSKNIRDLDWKSPGTDKCSYKCTYDTSIGSATVYNGSCNASTRGVCVARRVVNCKSICNSYGNCLGVDKATKDVAFARYKNESKQKCYCEDGYVGSKKQYSSGGKFLMCVKA